MKWLNKKDINEKGFTLVEIMVGAALMGLVSMASYSLLKNSTNSDKHFDKKNESSMFLAAYGQYLLGENGCARFVGFTPTFVYQNMIDNNYNGYGSVTAAPIQAGHVLKDRHVMIQSYQFRFKDDSNVITQNIKGNITKQQVLQIRMRIALSRKGFTLADGAPKIEEVFYEVPVLTNNADLITGCDINMTEQEICETLSLHYDAATESCVPDLLATSCVIKGSYATVSCSPSGYGCNSSFGGTGFNYFTGAASCAAGETAYRTGFRRTSYRVGCGKKCTVRITRNETIYTCMVCPP